MYGSLWMYLGIECYIIICLGVLSSVVCGLWCPGFTVRDWDENQRWETRIQDFEPPQNSKPHGLLIGERPTKGLNQKKKAKPHPKACKLQ